MDQTCTETGNAQCKEGYSGNGRPFREDDRKKVWLFEEYRMEDAEYAVVIIGSAAGTCKAAIEHIRHTTGKKVGLIKIRSLSSFPGGRTGTGSVQSQSSSHYGSFRMFCCDQRNSLGAEVRASMYQAKLSAEVVNYFYGLGGRDITVEDF